MRPYGGVQGAAGSHGSGKTPSRRATGPRRSREPLSTSTLTSDGNIVPWLAAAGPLAYCPEEPPDRDYYFQYGWIVPEIFAEDTNRRRLYYFGVPFREHARDLFDFWRRAREGKVNRVAFRLGSVREDTVTTPLAVYRAMHFWGDPAYLLMQHGSYQLVQNVDQPHLEAGEVLLYRGVQDSPEFRHLIPVDRAAIAPVWGRYVEIQSYVLSDSKRSFNSIHDRAVRCETEHIRDRTRMTNDIARDVGLDIDGDGFAAQLWDYVHQSFSLVRDVAKWKFGPHYVVCKTPIDNIRLTTFFAGEHEVRIIDPVRVEFVEAHGCKVVETDERPAARK